MNLTPESLVGAYNYLLALEPFSKWPMPDADELGFRVSRHKDRYGHFEYDKGPFPEVAISEHLVKTHGDLIPTMGHEMIHIYQWHKKRSPKRVQHNREFKRLARLVCRRMHLDYATFM